MDTKYDSLEPFYLEPQKKYELINRATEQLDGSTFHSEPGEETVNGITNYASISSTYIEPVEKYDTLNSQKVESERKYYNGQTLKYGENLSYPIPGLEAVKYDEIKQNDQHLQSIDKQCVTEGRENPEVPHGDTYIGNKNIYEDLDNIEISYSIDAENAHSSNSEHQIIKKDVNVSTIERNLKDKKELINITITKKTCLAVSITLALLFLLALIGGMVYYFYFINVPDSTSETNTDFPINITTQETTIMSLPYSSTGEQETTIMSLPSSSTDVLETTLTPLPTNIIETPCINITCKNNGSCHERDIGSVCECPVGFEGTFCEIVAPCIEENCENNGTCPDDPSSGPECDCPEPYVGDYCQILPKGNCSNVNCLHDGNCTLHEEYGAICKCPETHSGLECEIEINPCDSDPCENGGTCVRGDGIDYTCLCGYECQCANVYDKQCSKNLTTCDGRSNGLYPHPNNCSWYTSCLSGVLSEVNCNSNPNNTVRLVYDPVLTVCNRPADVSCADAEIDECDSSPCQNGGTCTDKVNGYECRCASCGCANEEAGPNCEIDTSECRGKADGYFYSPITCSDYIQCVNYTVIERSCPMGTVFFVDDNPRCENPEYLVNHTCAVDYTVAPCIEENCENNGTCPDDLSSGPECDCPEPYVGDYCQILPKRNCSDVNCLNGGNCTIHEEFGAICECPETHTGEECESEIGPCDNNPCENGGTCVKGEGIDYTCLCGYNCQCANEYDAECAKNLTSCEGLVDGNHPHPNNCSWFISCRSGAKFEVDCNGNPNITTRLVYDHTIYGCNWDHAVACADADIATVPPPPTTVP